MKLLLAVIVGLWVSVDGLASATYGKKIDESAKKNSISELSKLVGQNKLVTLEGKVVDVCSKKGCWMGLSDGTGEVRIRFEGYSFFVPMKLKGQKIRVEGRVQEKTLSVKDQQHYAKDAGKSEKEIAAIKKEKQVYEFEARGVKVLAAK
ncbi:MAG: DUF4920 domain-containing protein [Pseudobacteriovorax sp.]|nr:DUF4920 domain-containing protein [Pseudobacteriovorax sp.]